MKKCTKCGLTKETSEFHATSYVKLDGTRSIRPNCKSCENQRSRDYHHADKGRSKKRHIRWRNSAKYNLTEDQYQALMNSQGGLCAICGNTCSSGRSLAIDHDHTTGRPRGLLCGNCNNGLGRFKDQSNLLEAAAMYLRKWGK